MPDKGQSKLRQIAVEKADPSSFGDKPGAQQGHPPMPEMPVTTYKDVEPQVKPSPLPHAPPTPFKNLR